MAQPTTLENVQNVYHSMSSIHECQKDLLLKEMDIIDEKRKSFRTRLSKYTTPQERGEILVEQDKLFAYSSKCQVMLNYIFDMNLVMDRIMYISK
jgi:hypothetical protein